MRGFGPPESVSSRERLHRAKPARPRSAILQRRVARRARERRGSRRARRSRGARRPGFVALTARSRRPPRDRRSRRAPTRRAQRPYRLCPSARRRARARRSSPISPSAPTTCWRTSGWLSFTPRRSAGTARRLSAYRAPRRLPPDAGVGILQQRRLRPSIAASAGLFCARHAAARPSSAIQRGWRKIAGADEDRARLQQRADEHGQGLMTALSC